VDSVYSDFLEKYLELYIKACELHAFIKELLEAIKLLQQRVNGLENEDSDVRIQLRDSEKMFSSLTKLLNGLIID
jgi:hypothetical protein